MKAALFLVLRGQSIDLNSLPDRLADLYVWQRSDAFTLALSFFAVYVAVVALSLPLAVWMTLAAGALFGFWQRLVIVSFASTVRATFDFLASRYLLRDWVPERLGARATVIDEGLRRDGTIFQFSLQLIPLFAVNLLIGLTPISTKTFYLVSQVGMLAGPSAYVNAGTRLAGVEILSGIVSPTRLLSFALLGLFRWIARMLLHFLNRRKVYASWT